MIHLQHPFDFTACERFAPQCVPAIFRQIARGNPLMTQKTGRALSERRVRGRV